MPGYDRTGPVGAGPLTGRGLGRCGGFAGRARGLEEPYDDYRVGWFPRRGGRGRGGGRGGRGNRWGFGMGRWAIGDPDADDLTAGPGQAFLRRRIKELTEQLDRLNRQLSGQSSERIQNEEQE